LDIDKFRDDVYAITELLSSTLDENQKPKLNFVRQRLIDLYKENIVKINHSVLELICASELILHGYNVDVEKSVSNILVCDLFASKNNGSTIIEIETGFTPPEHALDTVDYYTARIVSKIARYSQYCTKFCLATPIVNVLPIPELFLIPPKARTTEQIEKIKKICDRFYRHPQIKTKEIQNARINSVYLINTDKGIAKEIDPEEYLSLTKNLLKVSEFEV
jgi:hypothetical protein|tara:strand:+ start:605 stop:1264 length:660 start_codon:yes stop_codon:yes gene_type:complete